MKHLFNHCAPPGPGQRRARSRGWKRSRPSGSTKPRGEAGNVRAATGKAGIFIRFHESCGNFLLANTRNVNSNVATTFDRRSGEAVVRNGPGYAADKQAVADAGAAAHRGGTDGPLGRSRLRSDRMQACARRRGAAERGVGRLPRRPLAQGGQISPSLTDGLKARLLAEIAVPSSTGGRPICLDEIRSVRRRNAPAEDDHENRP